MFKELMSLLRNQGKLQEEMQKFHAQVGSITAEATTGGGFVTRIRSSTASRTSPSRTLEWAIGGRRRERRSSEWRSVGHGCSRSSSRP